jgi:hypothetical protein
MRNDSFARLNLNAPNCCSPVGPLRCNAQGITEMNLASLELSGTLSALDLLFLENLTLARNNITGPIPSWNVPLLRRLDLSRNYLQGTIPSMQLPRLEYLNLEANNGLTGTLPEWNAPLTECRLPTSVCYDITKTVPPACRVMIKCPDETAVSPPAVQPESLTLGAKLGIGFAVAAFVILCIVGLVIKYKKPETPSGVLKILKIGKKPTIEIAPDAEIRLVKTTDHYDITYEIISSYK